MPFDSVIPDSDLLLHMAPEELAGPLLQHLISIEDSGTQLNRYNFSLSAAEGYQNSPRGRQAEISYALMEAWSVLEREGLIAPSPVKQSDWVFVTRRGKQIRSSEEFEVYRISTQLPKNLLHPQLIPKVWGAFSRGEYDTAVFEAFKEVEIAVRTAANMKELDYGTDLVRWAFNANNGPLSDSGRPKPERQALSDLFAGAIGSYKNPHSHRRVAIQAGEAVKMIMLASHLLGIVDARLSAINKSLSNTE